MKIQENKEDIETKIKVIWETNIKKAFRELEKVPYVYEFQVDYIVYHGDFTCIITALYQDRDGKEEEKEEYYYPY